jgi:phospholipid/cholesterol/gamma-HCH transport system substrate-binding protein
MRMRTRKRVAGAAVGLAVLLGATGCQWDGLNTLPMPGAAGTGAGSWQVRIQMPNVTTLTRNSPVMVDDVTVGTVTSIEVQDWHALVTVSLDKGVQLPENTVASVGQTSLLGSNHVELAAPTDERPTGQLKNGDLIPLAHAGLYPTTEQTLSSLSVVLNGGGISQLQTITHELNATFSGRENNIRDLIPQLQQLTASLNQQTSDIINAMNGLDHFGGVLARQKDDVANAIQNIHPALTVLADRRPTITRTITSLGDLSAVVDQIIAQGGDNLKAELADLWPVLKGLADTGNNLTTALQALFTFPFPVFQIDKAIKGDFFNLYVTYDVTAPRLDSNFLTGTPLGGHFGGVQAKYGVEAALGTFAGTGGVKGDPVQGPPKPGIPGLPPIPGLPSIPGLTAPTAPQGGSGR